MSVYLALLLILGGSFLLAWSADRFTHGAAALAGGLKVSPLFIGITLVGFSTSLPEMIVSGVAAFQGNPILGVGNAIGSNIANIGLVLGVSSIITPIHVHSSLLRREFVLLLFVVFGVALMLSDNALNRIDGIFLFSAFIVVLVWFFKQARKTPKKDPMMQRFEAESHVEMPLIVSIFWLVLGLVLLFVSSKMFVMGAVEIAKRFGISELVIGLTVVAIGTSLPEMATAVTSALKKQHEMAIGNIVGSCLFNLLAVLAMPALIHPTLLPKPLLYRDFPVMIALILLLFLTAYGFKGRAGRINRLEGVLLLSIFAVYIGFLVFGA